MSLAICVCPVGYEGLQCEYDLDGCADNPCYSEVMCTDVPAAELALSPAGFKCHPCPFGLVGDGTLCIGQFKIIANACYLFVRCCIYAGVRFPYFIILHI